MTGTDGALRPLRRSDAPAVLAAFESSGDLGRQGDVRDLTSASVYVARLLSTSPPAYAFAVVDSDDLVGLVGVSVDDANRLGWFWYWMRASHRGRGWGTRAATAVADWALREGGLERLELGHRADNPASGAVARAAGFVAEGCERGKFLIGAERVDVLTYGRLAGDPWPTGPGMSGLG